MPIKNQHPPVERRITIGKSHARFTKSAAEYLELEAGEPLLFLSDGVDEGTIYLQLREHDDAIAARQYDDISVSFAHRGFRNAFGLDRDAVYHLVIGDPTVVQGQLTYPLTIKKVTPQ